MIRPWVNVHYNDEAAKWIVAGSDGSRRFFDDRRRAQDVAQMYMDNAKQGRRMLAAEVAGFVIFLSGLAFGLWVLVG